MISIINESIEYNDTLNPKIWDIHPDSYKDDELRPEVKNAILSIVSYFTESMEVPISIADIYILGSNASYNYSDTSDLDVHIVANYDIMDADLAVVQSMYNAIKAKFNSDYDMTIHGINVELYIEDVRSSTISNGIYSVLHDKWIRFPEHLENVKTDVEDSELLNKYRDNAYELVGNSAVTSEQVEDFINDLYVLRQQSLMTEGEFGDGNLIFKEIRSDGLLDKLKDKYKKLISSELSIESVNRND